jgi:hypothetical protein
MTDDILKNEYFECDCRSDEHTLKFSILDIPEEHIIELGTSVFLNNDFLFWDIYWMPRWIMAFLNRIIIMPARRTWIAIKYIFGYKCKYGHWDCFDLRYEDCDRFMDMIRSFKIRREQYNVARKRECEEARKKAS